MSDVVMSNWVFFFQDDMQRIVIPSKGINANAPCIYSSRLLMKNGLSKTFKVSKIFNTVLNKCFDEN